MFDMDLHCVKSVCIQSFSGPYFPAFGLNTERHSVSLHIQSKSGKIRTIKTPNTEIFHAVLNTCLLIFLPLLSPPQKYKHSCNYNRDAEQGDKDDDEYFMRFVFGSHGRRQWNDWRLGLKKINLYRKMLVLPNLTKKLFTFMKKKNEIPIEMKIYRR